MSNCCVHLYIYIPKVGKYIANFTSDTSILANLGNIYIQMNTTVAHGLPVLDWINSKPRRAFDISYIVNLRKLKVLVSCRSSYFCYMAMFFFFLLL